MSNTIISDNSQSNNLFGLAIVQIGRPHLIKAKGKLWRSFLYLILYLLDVLLQMFSRNYQLYIFLRKGEKNRHGV
jgi:hypothetical protein